MENKSLKTQNLTNEEEKIINWLQVQESFKKNFGNEIYSSWLRNISLQKEFNDYLVLGVPTRCFRDWIVSRYLDKILEELKKFKLSINRVEFRMWGEKYLFRGKAVPLNSVAIIKDSILNHNRLNPNFNFDNFICGQSNELAVSYSRKSVKI